MVEEGKQTLNNSKESSTQARVISVPQEIFNVESEHRKLKSADKIKTALSFESDFINQSEFSVDLSDRASLKSAPIHRFRSGKSVSSTRFSSAGASMIGKSDL